MKYNKIIFLDVDGVINTEKHYFTKFDEECLDRLKNIIEKTNAKIVISSSWRTGDLEETKKYFPTWLQEYIVGETIFGWLCSKQEKDSHVQRGVEIQKWIHDHLTYPWYAYPEMDNQYRIYDEEGNFKYMNSNKLNINYTYVILDDDCDMLYTQKDNFVQTDCYKGINDNHMNRAIEILNRIQ